MAHWHKKLQDYNFKILHVARKNNTPTDTLSRPCNDEQEIGERQLSLLPESTFINLAKAGDLNLLEGQISTTQQQYEPWFQARKEGQCWLKDRGQWLDSEQETVIPLNQDVRRHIMHAYHDRLGAHLGRDETARKVLDRFCWPGGQAWIKQYVKGCMVCQQNKNITHQVKVPLYKITVPHNTSPFTQVAMDLITGLPMSQGNDSILTIVDYGCLQAAIFLPCQKTIMGP